ncbi:hypothetical protein KEK_10813 [Mycolicibacterium thermoresistibile ATCC 19527]|uniref:Uncharacterized protein n=1 Tax=Mycolicibacterium thermoresistibile (strain ATCC 19527 / DSM 44167 / CIP 105390 / JCM 6362 / NCTC 10409 / 316) TaxID=1078020 RepID=G7CIQ1_MYCT3|nr:hypothetical protein KEK_10813 [Mycolicibacterium thermoresistibile ATCC 19527]SNW16220.1 Uncharacterised protein [Mycolicibacterium thermoresistibile]
MPVHPADPSEGFTVRLVLLITAAAVAVLLWRSRRGAEVWHVAPDQPS